MRESPKRNAANSGRSLGTRRNICIPMPTSRVTQARPFCVSSCRALSCGSDSTSARVECVAATQAVELKRISRFGSAQSRSGIPATFVTGSVRRRRPRLLLTAPSGYRSQPTWGPIMGARPEQISTQSRKPASSGGRGRTTKDDGDDGDDVVSKIIERERRNLQRVRPPRLLKCLVSAEVGDRSEAANRHGSQASPSRSEERARGRFIAVPAQSARGSWRLRGSRQTGRS